jgi:divalent metal cation (Fe/Co/Zn/Cd) transporter
MDDGLTLEAAHERAHLIEQELRDQLGIEATIHMEPEGH